MHRLLSTILEKGIFSTAPSAASDTHMSMQYFNPSTHEHMTISFPGERVFPIDFLSAFFFLKRSNEGYFYVSVKAPIG